MANAKQRSAIAVMANLNPRELAVFSQILLTSVESDATSDSVMMSTVFCRGRDTDILRYARTDTDPSKYCNRCSQTVTNRHECLS